MNGLKVHNVKAHTYGRVTMNGLTPVKLKIFRTGMTMWVS